MKVTGIVLEIKNKTAFIYTNEGEFRKVKIDSEMPSIGQEYTGKSKGIHLIKGQMHPFRNAIFMFILTILISLVCFTYVYFSTTSTIIVDIGSSFELSCNRWSTVTEGSSIDNKLSILLKKISFKNRNADEALVNIINQCKTSHYVKKDKSILLYIHGDNVNLPKLKKFADNNSLKLIINSNGGSLK